MLVVGELGHELKADGRLPVGARAWGIANAVTADTGPYSAFTNIAGISLTTGYYGLASYQGFYGFPGLGTTALGGIIPVSGALKAGVTAQHFGDRYINNIMIGSGIAHTINRVSLGVKLSYHQLSASSASLSVGKRAVIVEMGCIVRLHPKLDVGAQAYNLLQASYRGDGTVERVPTLLRAGIKFKPTGSVSLLGEVLKDTEEAISPRFGIEYRIVPQLFVRTGVAGKPRTHHFGLGFSNKKFGFDYALTTHPSLGAAHHLSVTISFSGKPRPD